MCGGALSCGGEERQLCRGRRHVSMGRDCRCPQAPSSPRLEPVLALERVTNQDALGENDTHLHCWLGLFTGEDMT